MMPVFILLCILNPAMTDPYDRLKNKPQTGISRGELNYDERRELRVIQANGTTGLSQSNNPGKFTSVYYLDGDERDAAELFAEINSDKIKQIDLTKRNILQTSLSREIYDLVLDASGRRSITKYATVVTEQREDGTVWIINRDRYETQIDRRYTINEGGSAKVPAEQPIEALFSELGPVIAESDLRATSVQGDVRQVLDYFRVSDAYNCIPISTDDQELAVKKTT